MESKQEKTRSNQIKIPTPIQDAFYLGVGSSFLSLAFDVPGETAWKVGVACAGINLALAGTRSLRPKSRRPRGRQIPFSSERGNETIEMNYAIGQLGSETHLSSAKQSFLSRLINGKSIIEVKPAKPVTKPQELNEFTFLSHYDNSPFQLREVHVKLFLKSAWRNRQYGKGLSARRWVREFSQRPAWWKELSPFWYYAFMNLLYDAQGKLGVQMVIEGGNQWRYLAHEPRYIFVMLKWHQSLK